MQALGAQLQAKKKTVALVPTMGCLHRGHRCLIEVAQERAQVVVVSVFVNPVQFGPGEDFDKYPRTEAEDIAMCKKLGVNILFMPSAGEMFPPYFSSGVEERQCSTGLCGAFRPGHFRGVATVVLMLFNIVRPQIAIFGQKDIQQAAMVSKMIVDFFVPVAVFIMPTIRELDGLALSSRNRYLSEEERKVASQLFVALNAAYQVAKPGVKAKVLTDIVAAHLARFSLFRVQYIELVDSAFMSPIEAVLERLDCMLIAAAYLGTTRLIDNIRILPCHK